MEILVVVLVLGVACLVAIVGLSRLLGYAESDRDHSELDIKNFERVREALNEALPEAEDTDAVRDLIDDR